MAETQKVPNPHDRLFKESFRHKDVALDELRFILPKTVLPLLDLQNIELDETELMDALFRQLFSDRLFRVPLKEGGDLFVWILFEHQSVRDRMITVRVLEYGTARWRAYRSMNPEATEIPILIPIVIAHDPEGRSPPVQLSKLYMGNQVLKEALGPYLIDYQLYLDDLQAQTEDEIVRRCQNPVLRAVLIALRQRGVVPEPQVPRWRGLFEDVAQTGNINAMRLIVWYLYIRGSEHVVKTIQKELPMAEQAVRTILDEVAEKGEERGEKKGALRILRPLLEERMVLQIPSEIEKQLAAASVDELEAWTRRILKGDHPKDIFNLTESND